MNPEERGIISWFTRNPIAANLLMVCILVGGGMSLYSIKKEFFPEYKTGHIEMTVSYPGASPQEVEKGVCVKIEEVIKDLEGIKQVRSIAFEGDAIITARVENGYSIPRMLEKIRTNIDTITTFPSEVERPVITEVTTRHEVMWVMISGDMDESSLKILAEKIRDEMTQLEGLSSIKVEGTKQYEISIEVSESALTQYGLTFDELIQAIRNSSLDLPGGAIKTDGGEILLRAVGKAYSKKTFDQIVLKRDKDGTRVLLEDVAQVIDGFEDDNFFVRFQGKRAAGLQVFRVGNQNTLHISKAIKEYIQSKIKDLPEGIQLTPIVDTSKMLKDRLSLMTRNLLSGGFLVFLSLMLFLRLRIAIWVIVGIPVCFLGTIWLMPMPFANISINMITMFAFILVLGILVDDAIVIGESIFTSVNQHGPGTQNVIKGARKVAMPVTFGVLTTMAAFLPMLMIPGVEGKIWSGIALVIIFCLGFSLIESKLILPAHLAHLSLSKTPNESRYGLSAIQHKISNGLKWFLNCIYRPSLHISLRNRYTTLALFLAIFIVVFGVIESGLLRMVFFPDVESDSIVAELEMVEGTPEHATESVCRTIEKALEATNQDFKNDFNSTDDIIQNYATVALTEKDVFFYVELLPSEKRHMGSEKIINHWRQKIGNVPGVVELKFSGSEETSSSPIDIQLDGRHVSQLTQAAEELKQKLRTYPGVFDIRDTFRNGQQELRLNVKPEGEFLGLNMRQLAEQVRYGFFGAKIQTIQRNRDDVNVMIRYPKDQRRSIAHLEQMNLRTENGEEIPFSSAANALPDRGFSIIERVDRKRVLNVLADVDKETQEPQTIRKDMAKHFIPELVKKYPAVHFEFSGEAKAQEESMAKLKQGAVLAIFLIFALMAIPLKSYFQPLLIMAAIPFGIVGAVMGHLILGLPLSILSVCGMIALTGVVVNDSLVMIDYINKTVQKGVTLLEAVQTAGVARFRAIMLTSLTTFFGLLPMVTERSLQAQFLIPMATSLAFGILFATMITLYLIPSLYIIGMDIKKILNRLFSQQNTRQEVQSLHG